MKFHIQTLNLLYSCLKTIWLQLEVEVNLQ